MANLSSGGMLTETYVNGLDALEVPTYDILDELQISWLGWDYKDFAAPNGTWSCAAVQCSTLIDPSTAPAAARRPSLPTAR